MNHSQALTGARSNPLQEEEKNKAKPQPSTKNNQPSKQNCNPTHALTDLTTMSHDQSHHCASKSEPQTTTIVTHH